jgi:electron transfer flavoprotein alpha/beta subunit
MTQHNLIRARYEKREANIILNGEKAEVDSTRGQGGVLLPTLLSIVCLKH